MGDDNSILGKVISMFITVMVGVTLLIAGLPTLISQINSISDIDGITSGQASQLEGMFFIVLLMGVLVLVVAIVSYFANRSDR